MGTLWTVWPMAAARYRQGGICSRRRGEGVGAAGSRGPRCFGADATRRGLAGACRMRRGVRMQTPGGVVTMSWRGCDHEAVGCRWQQHPRVHGARNRVRARSGGSASGRRAQSVTSVLVILYDTMMSCDKHRPHSLPRCVAMARKCKCRAGKCGECSRCKKFQCRCERHPEDMECICHGVNCSKCEVCTTPLQMSRFCAAYPEALGCHCAW